MRASRSTSQSPLPVRSDQPARACIRPEVVGTGRDHFHFYKHSPSSLSLTFIFKLGIWLVQTLQPSDERQLEQRQKQ